MGKTNLSDRQFYSDLVLEYLKDNNLPNNPSLLTAAQLGAIVEHIDNSDASDNENENIYRGRDRTLANRWRAYKVKYGDTKKPTENTKKVDPYQEKKKQKKKDA